MLSSTSISHGQCITIDFYSSYGMVLASSMGATDESIQDLALGVLIKGNGMLDLILFLAE